MNVATDFFSKNNLVWGSEGLTAIASQGEGISPKNQWKVTNFKKQTKVLPSFGQREQDLKHLLLWA